MFDGIEFRGFSQKLVRGTMQNSLVFQFGMDLTDEWHPTQMIADF